ncbi:MAG: hypothetical protein V2J55_09365 [Candidatus Competibacteraceae bacterium]|jgi:hypothetical protein|nr:hypothetical protein [Candidatus Competibacteraceae bacterium]
MALHLLGNTRRRPVRCVIRIGSEKREEIALYSQLQAGTIFRHSNQTATASLTLEARIDDSDAWSLLQGTGTVVAGDTIHIEADFGPKRQEIMRGFVGNLRVKNLHRNTYLKIVVECQDESWPLQQQPVHTVWKSDSQIRDRWVVSAILEKYGLTLDSNSAWGAEHEILVQDASDFDFLRQRAEANRYELLFNAGSVYFGPTRLLTTPQPSIMIAGTHANCGYFSVHRSHNMRDDTEYLTAEGELDSKKYGHVLQVGRPVQVDGDDGYGGIYHVDAVAHHFAENNYRQLFNLSRPGDLDWAAGELTTNVMQTPSLLYQVL